MVNYPISLQMEKNWKKTDEKFITTIVFTSADKKEYHIFYNYGFYICGFSYDGNHFVLVDDSGVMVAKREH